MTTFQWPTQAKLRQFYGEPGGPACTAGTANLPFPMRIDWDTKSVVTKFRCHEKVESAFERIFQKTHAHYGHEKIKTLGLDLFGGCYNFRKMRGGTSWSTHSWGIAVDLNPGPNDLHFDHTKATFARPEYKPFWEIVESEGAVSLGRVKDFDWMHFQFARLN